MSFASVPGGPMIMIGAGFPNTGNAPTSVATAQLDAANEALIVVGRLVTSDGASHTLDTTGSSAIYWRTGSVTFANAGTTVKVGLADVDTANGPPGRASNAAGVISFDVSADLVGGGGGITASAGQTSVPTTGTKTVANGDLVSLAIQMTARGGADSVVVNINSAQNNPQEPVVTTFLSSAYSSITASPNMIIRFSDGAFGWFVFSDVAGTSTTRTFNNASTPNERGQLFSLPFPVRICGLYGWIDPDSDFDLVLYSDPLGTPVAERTISFDANRVAVGSVRRLQSIFSSSYDVAANTPFAVIVKPTTASNMATISKTLADAAHRVADAWGTDGYGVTRSGGSGAFADANSSLDHYYVGIIASGFEVGGGGGLASPMFGMGVS